VKKAKPTLTVTITEYEQPPLVLGVEMLSLGDKDDPAHGSVVTGSGCGSDAIVLSWRGRGAIVRGKDLIRAWVSTWAPEDAKRMP
jgi:hypothetical protein